jgi:hypothetical protein
LHRLWGTHKRTCTIYPSLSTGGIKVCAVANLCIPKKNVFGGGAGVYEKESKRKKSTFTRYVDFFLFLKLIFDRIFIPRQKKDGVFRVSVVRSFVCPSGRHFFVSPTHFLILLGRGYLLVNFDYYTSFYTLRKQSLGVYRNHPFRPSVRPSVHPSMYLVSATPPKQLIGSLWNFTHL